MNKRHKQIVRDTIARWRETILNTGRGDIDAAKKLINKSYRNVNVFVVDTPAQFYIAQGVIRKRISKQYAREVACVAFDIKPDFIDELRGDGGPVEFLSGRSWARRSSNSLLDRTWLNYMNEMCHDRVFMTTETAIERQLLNGPNRWNNPVRNINLDNMLLYQTCNLHQLYFEFVRKLDMTNPLKEIKHSGGIEYTASIHGLLAFTTQRMIENACLTLADAVSGSPTDIIEGSYNFRNHMFDATNAEIMCRILNCKNPAINIFHEIFHFAPAVMRFRNSFLLLAERPKITLNSEQLLHSENGPAVSYSDGTGFWFLGGHVLRERGEQIILKPETLTGEIVDKIQNEEERRVAIDRMGWEKYLTEIGATVLDTRENWVDNTTEVLFQVPANRRREEPLRALLACRSTGRRYFLAVPNSTEQAYWRRDKAKKITKCEDVQKWMADGATSDVLPYAKHSVRVIGAS